MNKSAFGQFMGFLLIASLGISSCQSKEGFRLGVTESSARWFAGETCNGFAEELVNEGVIQREAREEEVREVCQDRIEELASGPGGIQQFRRKEEAFEAAFAVMNSLHSALGGAPWGAEGTPLTQKLAGKLHENWQDLVPCVIGSSLECR